MLIFKLLGPLMFPRLETEKGGKEKKATGTKTA